MTRHSVASTTRSSAQRPRSRRRTALRTRQRTQTPRRTASIGEGSIAVYLHSSVASECRHHSVAAQRETHNRRTHEALRSEHAVCVVCVVCASRRVCKRGCCGTHRAAPTPTHVTGTPTSSSTRVMYACACRGSEANDRHALVLVFHPGIAAARPRARQTRLRHRVCAAVR